MYVRACVLYNICYLCGFYVVYELNTYAHLNMAIRPFPILVE